jgi:hypothetical protein
MFLLFLEKKMINNLVSEFKNAGLLRSGRFEAFIDREEQGNIDAQIDVHSKGKDETATTTATVATGVSPMGMSKRKWPQEIQEEVSKKCEGILESIKSLAEIYEDMTGKNAHEMFCPDCKSYDLAPGTVDKGAREPQQFHKTGTSIDAERA